MAYIGKGSQSQVLTVNAGLAEWQDSTGGIGVTVAQDGSIGADFSSLVAAVAAGNRIITVIGDVVESADVGVLASGLNIRVTRGSDINMAANSFVFSDDSNLEVFGNGAIIFTAGATHVLFESAGNIGRTTVDGMTFNNGNTNTTLADGSGCVFSNCKFTGETKMDGEGNKIAASTLHNDLIVSTGSINFSIDGSTVYGSVVDSGVGTVMSNIITG